jgi:vesicle-fusing ATPase
MEGYHNAHGLYRHDNTGRLQPGAIGASGVQRQWMGLSLTGDSVSVEPLPSPPAAGAPAYLESLDLEVGFLRKGQELAEQLDTEEMSRNFLKAFGGQIFASSEILVFDFHGVNLKATVLSLGTLELADAQRRGGGGAPSNMGILMEKTDITFVKAGDSSIKLKNTNTKKYVFCAFASPNLK